MEYYLNELKNFEKNLKGNGFDLNGFNPNSLNINVINSIINHEAIVLITDIHGIIIYVNDKCCAMMGYQREELIGQNTRIFNTGYHSTAFFQDLWGSLLSGTIWKGEMQAKRKDGSFVWNFTSIFPLLDDNNQPYQFLTLRTDITEQKEMEERARQKERQFNSFFELVHESIGCIDQQGNIMYVNPAFEKILGFGLSERAAINVFDYIDKDEILNVKQLMEEVIEYPSQSVTKELKLRKKDNSSIMCQVTVKNYLHDPFIKGIVFTYRDITEQKKNFQNVQRWKNFDPLTGLPNQRNCVSRLLKELDLAKENNSRFAILLIEVDDFKYVNETFGHDIGDKLLIMLSLRMKDTLGDNVFISRQGGDEFVFLLNNLDDFEVIHNTAKKLISLLNTNPFNIEGNEFFITASIGVSIFPYSGENVGVLLKNAELAMYRAKKNGKNQYQIFSSTMNLSSYKQFTLRNDFKKALLHRQFCVHYQPRINPVTQEIVSAEALIRWTHPVWGIVSPNEFIPMAEETGLIFPMGEWLIEKVCSQIKKWEHEKLAIKKISINLSPLQLLQPNFTDIVSSILKETDVDPKWIEFEITESVLIEKEDQVLKTMTQLKKIGISFALDDFGTGYSSLNYLRKLPCDTIKIDKSLINEIHYASQDYEIVSAIITLCRKLKKAVVAEGVETESQLSLLMKLGCKEVQGYYYSKPVSVEEFGEFLNSVKWAQKDKIDIVGEKNQRKDFRISLKIPLVADMTIEGIGSNKLHIGSSEVLITNIGPGGLRFHSSIKLPVNEDMILRFSTEILSRIFHFKGRIVWQKELENNIQQYGVQFIITKKSREKLIMVLKHLQVQLKENSTLPDTQFSINQ